MITPESHVAMPLWRLAAVVASIVVGTVTIWRSYDGLQQAVTTARQDIIGMRTDLAKLGPGSVRDVCREVLREETKFLIVQCPKHLAKGEAIARCQVISRDEK